MAMHAYSRLRFPGQPSLGQSLVKVFARTKHSWGTKPVALNFACSLSLNDTVSYGLPGSSFLRASLGVFCKSQTYDDEWANASWHFFEASGTVSEMSLFGILHRHRREGRSFQWDNI